MTDEPKTEGKNQTLHRLLGRCMTHRPSRKGWKGQREMPCEGGCGEVLYWQAATAPTPDYLSPDSPRRLLDDVEREVIEKVGMKLFVAALSNATGGSLVGSETERLFRLATASPDDRVTALIEVLTNGK